MECKPDQQEFFKRVYPNMPNKKQLDWAIQQVENTIEKNKIYDKQIEEIKELKNLNEKHIKTIEDLNNKNYILESDNKELRILNAEFSLKPIDKNAKDLLLLDALRSAGVDNWDGYDCAIEIYEKNLLK